MVSAYKVQIFTFKINHIFAFFNLDFYDFACKNWQKNEFIPDDKSSISMFGKLRDDLRLKLRILLESPITNKTEDHVKKAVNFYRSCMNLGEC